MSQNILATAFSRGRHGRIRNLAGSGLATISLSSRQAKPSYRRAIERNTTSEAILQLFDSYCEALQVTPDVGEPQPDELYVVFPGGPDYEILRLLLYV
jgi:hypothetical protein